MQPAILILLSAAVLLLILLLIRITRQEQAAKAQQAAIKEEQLKGSADTTARVTSAIGGMLQPLSASLTDSQRRSAEAQNFQLEQFRSSISDQFRQLQQATGDRLQQMSQDLRSSEASNSRKLEEIREANEKKLEAIRSLNETKLEEIRSLNETKLEEIRQQNEKKLDEIRGTVEEKLQDALNKRIAESFQTVSRQLEQVYRGLGEMQTLASDVGSLKKVLSGVKTRGILGEIQLGAILTEILSPGQYDTNVATIPGSPERVEFAVRLPGAEEGTVYLPIDSKFPGDTYAALREAQDSCDKPAIAEAYRRLELTIRQEAKDIRDKYVSPPYTTNFGVMFLPVEGLYAEVVSRGLLEELQVKYHVNIAGPSTMAALLSSLQMGFRTLAIQKRSGDVWQILGEVKTEFAKFEDSLTKMQHHLQQTSSDLDSLIGVRTRAIRRKLRTVQEIETDEPDV